MKGQTRKTGFTLVELLTVIVIISLLLTILVPTVAGIARGAYAKKTATRIHTLDNGIAAYYEDTGRRFYPGQQYLDQLRGGTDGTPNPTGWTGSQWLSRALFTRKNGTFPGQFADTGDPSYATYAPDMFITNDSANYANPAANTNNMAISDNFPDPMPICYYVSRPRLPGVGQFVSGLDNNIYTDVAPNPAGNAAANFAAFVTSNASVGLPHDGEYLLIAPGVDRKFFTSDDVTNWNR